MVKHLPNDIGFNAIFQALDPVRPATLEQRAEGLKNVGELAEPRDISLAAISKHIQVLMDMGLLADEKDGRVRLCYLDAAPLDAVFRRLTQYCILWEDQFEPLANHLENEDQ